MGEPRTESGRRLVTLIGNIRERAGLPRFDGVYADAIFDIEREAARLGSEAAFNAVESAQAVIAQLPEGDE
jgi:hypothetical protein